MLAAELAAVEPGAGEVARDFDSLWWAWASAARPMPVPTSFTRKDISRERCKRMVSKKRISIEAIEPRATGF